MWKCGNERYERMLFNFHIFTFSNFHIPKLKYICTLFIIILNKLKGCGYLK